jgi:uridine phosphorylase
MGYPNLRGKHAEDSMITPREVMEYRKRIGAFTGASPPRCAILCYQSRLWNHITNTHETEKLEGFFGDVRLLGETGGRIAVAGGFGVGAPAAVLCLEALVAFGVTQFLSIGTAGTLQPDVKVGSIVVCDRAIRDEGTSHHYVKHSKYSRASRDTTARITMSLTKAGLEYRKGTSWTVDAFYRETVAEARQYQAEGVAAVDMRNWSGSRSSMPKAPRPAWKRSMRWRSMP